MVLDRSEGKREKRGMTSRDEKDVRSANDLDNAKADYDMTDEWIANPNEEYTDLRDMGLERGE